MTDPYDAFIDVAKGGGLEEYGEDPPVDTPDEYQGDDPYVEAALAEHGGCLVFVFALGLIPLIAKLVLA